MSCYRERREAEIARAGAEGRQAARDGKDLADNPYNPKMPGAFYDHSMAASWSWAFSDGESDQRMRRSRPPPTDFLNEPLMRCTDSKLLPPISISAAVFRAMAANLYKAGRQRDIRCGADAWFIFDGGKVYECNGPDHGETWPIRVKI